MDYMRKRYHTVKDIFIRWWKCMAVSIVILTLIIEECMRWREYPGFSSAYNMIVFYTAVTEHFRDLTKEVFAVGGSMFGVGLLYGLKEFSWGVIVGPLAFMISIICAIVITTREDKEKAMSVVCMSSACTFIMCWFPEGRTMTFCLAAGVIVIAFGIFLAMIWCIVSLPVGIAADIALGSAQKFATQCIELYPSLL